jgi:thioredoxin 1
MKENFFDIIAGDKPVLVDFYSEGCGPCISQGPILGRLSARTEGQCRILKIDAFRNAEVSAKYAVRAVPTLILFRNGAVKWRATGLQSESTLAEVIARFSA